MSDEQTERRIEMVELKGLLTQNTKLTEEVKRAVLGQNGEPGLVTKNAVTEEKVRRLEKYKRLDRGLSVASGVFGGFVAVLGKAFLGK